MSSDIKAILIGVAASKILDRLTRKEEPDRYRFQIRFDKRGHNYVYHMLFRNRKRAHEVAKELSQRVGYSNVVVEQID